MNKNLLFGLIVGFGAFYLFEKVGKKPCPCQEATEDLGDAELLEPNPPNQKPKGDPSCEEAVAIVMAERRKTMRMSEQGFAEMEARELAKCKKMAGIR